MKLKVKKGKAVILSGKVFTEGKEIPLKFFGGNEEELKSHVGPCCELIEDPKPKKKKEVSKSKKESKKKDE